MKKFALYGGIALAVIILIACLSSSKYNEDWIIGKTYDQVVARYGEFDNYSTITDLDGSFMYFLGSYVVKPKRVGYLGTWQGTYFHVYFDKNGVAYECEEALGGKGG